MAECATCGAVDEPEQGIVVGTVGEHNESMCNVCRATELYIESNNILKKREVEVFALREQGMDDDRIAALLQALHNADSPKASTVASHRSNIRQKLDGARWMLNEIDEGRL